MNKKSPGMVPNISLDSNGPFSSITLFVAL